MVVLGWFSSCQSPAGRERLAEVAVDSHPHLLTRFPATRWPTTGIRPLGSWHGLCVRCASTCVTLRDRSCRGLASTPPSRPRSDPKSKPLIGGGPRHASPKRPKVDSSCHDRESSGFPMPLHPLNAPPLRNARSPAGCRQLVPSLTLSLVDMPAYVQCVKGVKSRTGAQVPTATAALTIATTASEVLLLSFPTSAVVLPGSRTAL